MTSTAADPSVMDSAFARLESEGRLLNPVHKGPTRQTGRIGFRGELALRFAPKLADEARPCCEQVIAAAQVGHAALGFFAGYLLSFEHLKDVAAVLGDSIAPGGAYFLFCNNLDLSHRYGIEYNGITWRVLPIDEATVYNELLDLLGLERNDLKKLDTGGKIDRIAEAAAKFDSAFSAISYADGVARMGPVRNPNENRPV